MPLRKEVHLWNIQNVSLEIDKIHNLSNLFLLMLGRVCIIQYHVTEMDDAQCSG